MNRRRSWWTYLELIIASALLGATMLSITAFRQRTLSSSQTIQRASFAQSRLLNTRRAISTWPIDEVTTAKIEDFPIDESAFLSHARWIAEVKEVNDPIVGKRVRLALEWQNGSEKHTSPSLVFWVKRP